MKKVIVLVAYIYSIYLLDSRLHSPNIKLHLLGSRMRYKYLRSKISNFRSFPIQIVKHIERMTKILSALPLNGALTTRVVNTISTTTF